MKCSNFSTCTRPGYKFAIGFLFGGAIVYMVGFAVPYWIKLTISKRSPAYQWTGELLETECDAGLWTINGKACERMPEERSVALLKPDWLKAVQCVQSLGLVFLSFACGYATYGKQTRFRRRCSRLLEILTGISSLTGFAGCVVYLAKMSSHFNNSPQLIPKDLYLTYHYVWGLYIEILACASLLISALLQYIFHEEIHATGLEENVHFSTSAVPEVENILNGSDAMSSEQGQETHARNETSGVYHIQAPPPYHLIASPPPPPPPYYPKSSTPSQECPNTPPPEYDPSPSAPVLHYPCSTSPVFYPSSSAPADYEETVPVLTETDRSALI